MVSMSGCCTLFSIPQAILMYILYVGDWSHWKENHHIPWNQPELGKGAQFTRRPAVQHWHWTWPFVICFPFIFKFFCTSVTYNSLAALTVQIWIRRMFVSSAITQALFHCLKLFFFSLFFVSPPLFGMAPCSPPSWLFSFSQLVSEYFLPRYLSTCKLAMLLKRKQSFKLVKMCQRQTWRFLPLLDSSWF